jgi:hypothetical protein
MCIFAIETEMLLSVLKLWIFSLGSPSIKYAPVRKATFWRELLLCAIMEIKRRILMDLYKSKELRKAVAFSLYIKEYCGISIISEYSVHKMRLLTGVSPIVIKKRVEMLVAFGLAEFVGKKRDILVLRTLKSNTKHRNVTLTDNAKYETLDNSKKNKKAQFVKHVDDLLCIYMIVEIQKHKDYACRTIQQRENPKNTKELKESRRTCNRAGWYSSFRDNGLSYKTIAERIGICVQKAVNLVKSAIFYRILAKQKNVRKKYCAGSRYIQDLLVNYTFILNDYVYKISANTYRVM